MCTCRYVYEYCRMCRFELNVCINITECVHVDMYIHIIECVGVDMCMNITECVCTYMYICIFILQNG